MGLFDMGWGDADKSTPKQRKDWRDNAKKQMGKDKPTKDKKGKNNDDGPPRHATKTSWW